MLKLTYGQAQAFGRATRLKARVDNGLDDLQTVELRMFNVAGAAACRAGSVVPQGTGNTETRT
ncbi:hypothetical protein AAGS40_30050 (plasmid) [Paraburkholderia sp. PREW-6R]|uniref:hypothetical protein n=1 Tax=Paraburkholderia sp. PREW-6R TaxID=3141544 RepID=UPI0031F527F9